MEYQDLTSLEEFRSVVELEKQVWEYTDAEDVVPVPILAVNVKRGGILVGAFDESHEMVGFVYSLPGVRRGQLTQWSHMLGVIEHQQCRNWKTVEVRTANARITNGGWSNRVDIRSLASDERPSEFLQTGCYCFGIRREYLWGIQ